MSKVRESVLMAPDDPEASHQTARMPGTDSVEAQQTVLGAPRPPELMQTAVDEKMPRLPWPREAEEAAALQRAGLSRWRSHPVVVVGAVVALGLVAALAVWLFSSR